MDFTMKVLREIDKRNHWLDLILIRMSDNDTIAKVDRERKRLRRLSDYYMKRQRRGHQSGEPRLFICSQSLFLRVFTGIMGVYRKG